jgi:23S rRNA pseudouridine955/2504/2580 synthase
MPLQLIAAPDDDGRRLDRILRKALRELPLSAIHRLLRRGCVLIDGKAAAQGRRVKAGETITVPDTMSAARREKLTTEGASRHRLAFHEIIIFEGAGLLILNKPAGISVHGKDSLEDEVRAYLAPKLPRSLSFRPGPLHRLDTMSSGVIVFSASLAGARSFSALMRERKIKKQYLALVQGPLEKAEVWRDELERDREAGKTRRSGKDSGESKTAGGKIALTKVTPLAKSAAATLILADIETGRTHQIRAQAAARGHPLLGDKKYGGKAIPGGQFLLHAWRMEFPPECDSVPRVVEAPLPGYFSAKIGELFGELALP